MSPVAEVSLRGAERTDHENRIGIAIVTTAIGVHRDLGPGLLGWGYEAFHARCLEKQSLCVNR